MSRMQFSGYDEKERYKNMKKANEKYEKTKDQRRKYGQKIFKK